ncbi:head completion/stabilization protein [Aurantiacibacter suaedae]|uniref:head completion/stabilization protein n=1 Tax=Aurantiacibacter suaedae TaxID=2545755 RepID=UPI0010F5518B|nr:head completion/stabilization protein [Aurantiacibacter suaedae]
MAGFISSPAPDVTAPGTILQLGPFWPDIDINHFRDVQRIGGTLIPDNRLIDALSGAVLTVDGDLAAWRAGQEDLGRTRLTDVPAAMIGDETRLVKLWRRAVYAHATADLRETHGDLTATGSGQSRGELLDMSAEDHRRNAVHAIRDIKGVGRTAVELI